MRKEKEEKEKEKKENPTSLNINEDSQSSSSSSSSSSTNTLSETCPWPYKIFLTSEQKEKLIKDLKPVFKKANLIGKPLWNTVLAMIEGAIDAYTLLNVILTIAEGFPASFAQVMQICSKYIILPVAVIGCINKTLDLNDINAHIRLQTLWTAGTNGIGLTSFFTQLAFFVTDDVIQAIKHLPNGSPINISNAWAWSIIGLCFGIGGIYSLQSYFITKQIAEEKNAWPKNTHFLQENLPDYTPSLRNFGSFKMLASYIPSVPDLWIGQKLKNARETSRKILTHHVTRVIMQTLVVASTIHSFIAQIQSGGTVTSLKRSIRYGTTGLTALGAGTLFSYSHPGHFRYQLLQFIVNITQTVTLGISAGQTYRDPIGGKGLNRVAREEQEIFWPLMAILLFFANIFLIHRRWMRSTLVQQYPLLPERFPSCCGVSVEEIEEEKIPTPQEVIKPSNNNEPQNQQIIDERKEKEEKKEKGEKEEEEIEESDLQFRPQPVYTPSYTSLSATSSSSLNHIISQSSSTQTSQEERITENTPLFAYRKAKK